MSWRRAPPWPSGQSFLLGRRDSPEWQWAYCSHQRDAAGLDSERECARPRRIAGTRIRLILQTQKYARAVYRTRVGDTDEEIEELVAARLERQAILARPKPPTLWVVIDEGVLHRLVAGAEVMLEQTEHLTEAARRPNIVVQVIPASVGAHEGLS